MRKQVETERARLIQKVLAAIEEDRAEKARGKEKPTF